MEQLRQALERAANGHGQVVAVVGEPGVGKSRLYWEFTRSHRTQGWLIVESSSVSYGKATAFLPIMDLLRGYFQIQPDDEARKIRERATGKLLALDRALESSLPALLWLLDIRVDDPQWQKLDAPQRRQQALDGIKHLLLRESQVQPVLVLFEDLHWIDAETQALLDALVESMPTARLLLLVNYRPEYRHGWNGKTYYGQLRIDPLSPESAEELLEALLGRDPSLQPLKRLLIERTDGNPFFLEESVRTLVETKALAGERGAYRLERALQAPQIPATAQAILAARIDRLLPEDKRLLQAASVVGKDVPLELLRAIVDEEQETLRRGLSHLQAAEFLYEARLFPVLRNVAQSLQGDLSRERFGQHAFPAVNCRSHLVWALAELGDFDEGIAQAQEGVRLAESVDHPYSLVVALWGLGCLYGIRGEYSNAIRPLDRALALTHEWSLPGLAPIVMAASGYFYALSGRVADGLALLRQAFTAMESMRFTLFHSFALMNAGEVCALAGRMEEAVALAERALTLTRERGERGFEAWALRLLGEIFTRHEPPEVEKANAAFRAAHTLATELGMRPLIAHAHLGLGNLSQRTGRREQAQKHLSTATSMYREMDMRSWFKKAEGEIHQLR